MMSPYRILLVCPENQKVLGGEIRTELEENLFGEEQQVTVDWVKSEVGARDFLADPKSQYHLIITALHIPPGPKTPLNPAESRGLLFLQSRRQEHLQIPSIVFAAAEDEGLSQSIRELHNSELVLEGATIFTDLLRYSQNMLTKTRYQESVPGKVPLAAEPVEPVFGNIGIKIKLDEHINVPRSGKVVKMVKGDYKIKGYNINYFEEGEIFLDFNTLKKLARKSKELEKETGWPKWQNLLRDVGATLKKQICDNNDQFRENFLEIVEMVKGIENTRIRFDLTFEGKADENEDEDEESEAEKLHSVVLEALVDLDEREFLMLQAPICRRLVPFKGEFPLFYQKGPMEINCLIIEAYTAGFPGFTKGGYEVKLNPLPHLKEESAWLEQNLGKMGRVRIGNICRISADTLPANYSFKAYVEEVLKKNGPWHLVHYAGHSFFDEKHEGYVFFPINGAIEPLKIEVFCKDLRLAKPQFVYLSSCFSSEADFVFQLANHGIPAILGFRWGIEDQLAVECAKIFYQFLFNTRSLEEAFWKTRRDIHDKYLQNKIWAAPLLVYQTSD